MTRLIQVLLVEDHLILQRCTKGLLNNRGCEVTVVGTKETALNEIQAGTFDLLLIDIGLPDGSGWQVIEYCRESSESKNSLTPIVVVSAHIQPSESEQYQKKYPSLSVILKPLSEEKIYRILSTYCLNYY